MFVVGPLLRAYLGEGPGEGVGGGGAGGFPRGADYLVITSRYPKPGETTPQNIKIVITFNQNLKPESVKFARPDLNNPKNTICDDWNFAVQDIDGNFIDGSFVIRGNSLIFIPKGDCPYPLDAFKCEKDQEGNCFLTFKKPG
ncbi:MAG: Ig-like domain-containing protein, partial [Patescibacteria group bacterium]